MSENLIFHTLKKYWGFDKFRPPQQEIVENILFGRDALITLPTGGGKSLCYQLPAVISKGLTIVISPLIALMQDQVESLNSKAIPACFLNSSLLPQQYRETVQKLESGSYKLLYLAPEQFRSGRLLAILQKVTIARVIIDEAHCLSEWGNDFRPDYRTFVSYLQKAVPDFQIVALTATATPDTRKEITTVLGLKTPYISVSSFDRTNLFLGIKSFYTPMGKYLFLKKLLNSSGKALVYCSTRENTRELFKTFSSFKGATACYNAGMEQSERKMIQEQYREGTIRYLFATTAFGMGIDISDIDTVIYWNFPASPEEYYQGIGRAGRNPQIEAKSWLLYYRPDYIMQRQRLSGSSISVTELKKVIDINSHDKRISRNTSGLPESTFNAIKLLLEENGSEDLTLIQKKYQAIIRNKSEKLAAMKLLISNKQCKRKTILNYFGEETTESNCNNCSYCLKRAGTRPNT